MFVFIRSRPQGFVMVDMIQIYNTAEKDERAEGTCVCALVCPILSVRYSVQC